MSSINLNWVDFYTEFATKLLEYKNDRKSLIEKFQNVYKQIDMKFPKIEKDETVIDIDPFTIFGFFNKGITDDNRKHILSGIKNEFKIEKQIPSSFDGIPLMNNMNAAFFYFVEERGENDINNLWDIFESAIIYSDNPTDENKLKLENKYDKVIQQKGVLWNITIGLYWIRPNTYINLDSKNRKFIITEKILPQELIQEINEFKTVPSGKQYMQLCDLLLDKIKNGKYGYSNFPELSFVAYENTGYWPSIEEYNPDISADISKNTILYGPPGTGKTYNTIMYAVAIIENKKLEDIKSEDYTEITNRYNKYKNEGLIEFTTFHQSYGYEEFIEGIKPIIYSDEETQTDIQYEVVPGLFKKFCDMARIPILKQKNDQININESPTIWKVSLQGSGDNPTRTECMQNGHIRIGYDDYGENIENIPNNAKGISILNYFINDMSIGDIVMSCYSCNTIDAIGVITGEYEWHNEYKCYKRLRNVNWIVKDIEEDIIKINNGITLTSSSVYKLKIALSDVMDIIKKYARDKMEVEEKKKNYVFIIDEINRGNISKIFGELITLIEPMKRIGQPEGIKVRLPYSQQLFGVPDNVYIIGTMNTADRSIANIDTALRRRFHFKEMLPDAEVFDGIFVDDVSIKDMFIKMNKRITVLFDREHTLGHAYFLPLKTEPTIETLANIFENSIIPLLQEYFYEDYEKIRLVLGDNQKDDVDKQFIIVEENDYNELFGGTDYEFDEMRTYRINSNAFKNIEAYRSI